MNAITNWEEVPLFDSEDAEAAVVLSTYGITNRPPVEHAPHLRRIPWIATDRLPEELAEQWVKPWLY